MRQLAYDIRDYLLNKKYYHDIVIYFDGLAISDHWKEEKVKHPKDYMNHYNDETITISFEGTFYKAINFTNEYVEFNKFINSKGYYFEFGNAWNLALYEL